MRERGGWIVQTEEILAVANEKNIVAAWDDAHRYTPAPRHRRRLILKMLHGLDFKDCLDTGCAQPFLLHAIMECFGVTGFGCDISDRVMAANRVILPKAQFRVLDLTRESWPDGRQFDLVVCSEVLEHIPNWQDAVANLVKMTRKHLLITVPSGPVRAMDQLVGHHRHFQGPELIAALERHGCTVRRERFWGFPLHSAYKALISNLSPARIYSSFSGGDTYGLGKRLFSHLLYGMFFLNDLGRSGNQLLVYATPPERPVV
jgi:SAM-dependent methyltransferase